MGLLELRAAFSSMTNGKAQLSEAIDGTVRVRLSALVDYSKIAPVLKQNDLELYMSPSGPLQFKIVGEVAENNENKFAAANERVTQNGPIKRCLFTGVTTTGAHFELALKKPTVLRVLVGQNSVCIEHILASDIKNGLAHRKRKGLLRPTKRPLPWPKTSKTQVLASRQVKASLSWRAYIFGS